MENEAPKSEVENTEDKPESPPAPPVRGTIILLEDADHSRNIVQFFLEKNQFGVLSFSNGKQALDYIASHEIPEIKLIISDIMMPEMTGLEFAKKIKEFEKLKAVPFVIMSAMTDKTNIMDAKKLGVKGYLLKPISVKKIIELLKKLFPDEPFIEPRNNK